MSSEFLPEDNAGQRRYRLWRDLSAAAPSDVYLRRDLEEAQTKAQSLIMLNGLNEK